MLRKFARNIKGFSLVEILLAVVIIGVLAALVIPRVPGWIAKAGQMEGFENLGAIRRAELMLHQLAGRFQEAQDHPAIQSTLDLVVGDKFYNYKVIEASEEDFMALAIPVWPYSQWLEEMAMNKDGFVSPIPGIYSGEGKSGGGHGSGSGSGGSGNSGGGGGSSGGGGGGGGTLIPIGPGQSIPLPDNVVFSITVNSPTGIQVISNDGWLTIGWNGFSDVSGYQVYRSDSDNGIYAPLTYFETNIAGDTVWADQVVNDQNYCYKVKAIANTTSGTFASNLSEPPICSQASASSPYSAKTKDVRNTLADVNINITNVDGVPDSDTLAQSLINNNVPLLFGYGSGFVNALAWFDPRTTTIGFDITQYGKSLEVLTVLLAHEMTHRIWDEDYDAYLSGAIPQPLLGTPPNPPGGVRSSNSIDQEYRSFLSMSQVWYAIKGNQTDPALDGSMQIVLNSDGSLVPEDEAKQQIKQIYAGIVDNDY